MLTDKIALVTGASRGIGRAIAFQLAQQGATVVGTATTQAGADRITQAFQEAGLKSIGLVLDVTKPAAINDVLSTIQAEYGHPTILVNNAGITEDNLMLRMKDEEWQNIIDTNLTSVYRMSKACLKGMMKARWGRIITIGSVIGLMGHGGQANYAAAKAAVIGFSKSLAQEVGSRGITVNVIAPGFIETDMTEALQGEQKDSLLAKIPLQRIGSPADIANAVRFLASDEAAYITGETLNVNGGMYMH